MKDLFEDQPHQHKTISPNNKASVNNSKNNSSLNIKKKKEINEYYIGNEPTVKNNNSTLIDQNEFFLNVLESQQLLVNSALNRIENDEESSEKTDLENTKGIKESKKNENSEKIINNLNTNNIEDLQKKIDKTLNRAKDIFIKDKKNNSNKKKKIKEKEKEEYILVN